MQDIIPDMHMYACVKASKRVPKICFWVCEAHTNLAAKVCLFKRVTRSKGIQVRWLGITSSYMYIRCRWEDWVLVVSLCKWIFCLLHVGLVYHLFLFPQLSIAKVGFSFIACFVMKPLSVCMYRKSIFISFVIPYFSLCFIACLFSFIENQAS